MPAAELTARTTPLIHNLLVWGQDAQRLGGLVHPNGTEPDRLLIELVLNNLATLHGISRDKMSKLVDHKAFNWHDDPFARGF